MWFILFFGLISFMKQRQAEHVLWMGETLRLDYKPLSDIIIIIMYMSRMWLPRPFLWTAGGSHHRNTDQLSFGLRFPWALIPGTDCTHTCTASHSHYLTHTHTHTHIAKSWFALVIISERFSVDCYLLSIGLFIPWDPLPPALIFACFLDSDCVCPDPCLYPDSVCLPPASTIACPCLCLCLCPVCIVSPFNKSCKWIHILSTHHYRRLRHTAIQQPSCRFHLN